MTAVNGLNISSPDYGHELWNNLAEEYTGKLVGVIDGDHRNPTQAAHQRIGVSVSMGDCPEYGQAYGKRAKQAASDLTFGKEVTIQTHGKDRYGRTLADVLLPNGANINHILVKNGWC